MEKLDQDEIVFIPPEDIRTKLCSKDDLYRIWLLIVSLL